MKSAEHSPISSKNPPVTASLSLVWIERLAIVTALASAMGLLSLTGSRLSWGQEPPAAAPGFTGGAKPFTNPFAPGAGAPPAGGDGNDFFDDDLPEEEDFDFPPPPGAGGNAGGANSVPSAPSSRGTPAFRSSTPGNSGENAFRTSGGGNPSSGGGISMGGTGTGVTNPRPQTALNIDSETGDGSKEMVTDFNFPDADILDIAKTLGKLTGKNFILDKDVKGRISIVTNSSITIGDAWRAFLTALDMNGFALIPSGKYIRIARQRDARDKQLKTFTGEYAPDTDALITRLFPLKYLSAEEVARNFRSFMPANSRIIPYEQTNTVIVTDTGSNISKLSKLLEILDVEGYDAGIEVIPVKFASAVELSKLIDTLIPGTSTGGTAGGTGARFGGAKFTARRTKEGGIINTIIADERTNTLIIHANTKGAGQVRELVNKLDQKVSANTGGGKVHVVYLQFAKAEEISTTLNNLSQSGGRTSGTTSAIGAGTGANPVQASLFEGAIRVSADKATNSLVITASPTDFDTVQRVINKLDIPRDQVYAEVVIMEVALNRDFTYSSNIINPAGPANFVTNTDMASYLTDPIAQKGAILSFASEGTRTLSVGGTEIAVPNLAALIKALQTTSNANVLATPQIMTLDNEEATFETAEKIPIPSTTAIQGSVATSVTKENVSLTITIKPQINKMSNFVKLDIQAKLADISNRELPAQVKDLAFATLDRTAKTSIVVADRDTVVMGGLMRDNQSEVISKVPILGDIPLLGWLFKSKRTESRKTNLLIFITPQIIRQYEKVRAILDQKLRERDEFIENGTGGEDANRKTRNKLIRNLPDMDKLLSEKPQNVQTIEKAEAPSEEPPARSDEGAAAPATGTGG
jgi:general secretion pathway protein D